MRHAFLETVARKLAERNVATLRYEFPYMAAGKSRVDSPAVATAAVREAVEEAARRFPGIPIVAGGKSFGGRMTSQAQADGAMPGVVGLAFLGFPLHAPGKPGIERAEHLQRVAIPMLFLQGTRDEFAKLDLLRPVIAALSDRATLALIDGGDHSFKAPKSAGSPDEIMTRLCDTLCSWAGGLTR
jgi:predicted alpha/beta-hydrolase family hydrolase